MEFGKLPVEIKLHSKTVFLQNLAQPANFDDSGSTVARLQQILREIKTRSDLFGFIVRLQQQLAIVNDALGGFVRIGLPILIVIDRGKKIGHFPGGF